MSEVAHYPAGEKPRSASSCLGPEGLLWSLPWNRACMDNASSLQGARLVSLAQMEAACLQLEKLVRVWVEMPVGRCDV